MNSRSKLHLIFVPRLEIATMTIPGRGYNPIHGYDMGAAPPTAFSTYGSHASVQTGQFTLRGWPSIAPRIIPPYYLSPIPGAVLNFFSFPGLGAGGSAEITHPMPPSMTLSSQLPSTNLGSSQGSMGLEAGYNYFFSEKNTKLNILLCKTAPWNMPYRAKIPFHLVQVPTNTTIAELLKGLGATGPDKKKNKVFEIQEGGNGKWYKGQSFSEDDDDAVKTLEQVGWNHKRGSSQPPVWLWIVKE